MVNQIDTDSEMRDSAERLFTDENPRSGILTRYRDGSNMARNVDEQIIDHRSASAKPRLRKVKGIYKHEVAVSSDGDDLADRRSYLRGVKAETRYYERAPAAEGGDFRLSRREETRLLGRDRVTDYGPGKSETVQKFRSNGERAKVTERGEDGNFKKGPSVRRVR